jgi:hypothetical protein
LSTHSGSTKKRNEKKAVTASPEAELPVVIEEMQTKSKRGAVTVGKKSHMMTRMETVRKGQDRTVSMLPMMDPSEFSADARVEYVNRSKHPRRSKASNTKNRIGILPFTTFQSVLVGPVRTSDTHTRESIDDDNEEEEDVEAVTVQAIPIDEAAYRDEVRQEVLREQHGNTGLVDDSSGTNPPLLHASVPASLSRIQKQRMVLHHSDADPLILALVAVSLLLRPLQLD